MYSTISLALIVYLDSEDKGPKFSGTCLFGSTAFVSVLDEPALSAAEDKKHECFGAN